MSGYDEPMIISEQELLSQFNPIRKPHDAVERVPGGQDKKNTSAVFCLSHGIKSVKMYYDLRVNFYKIGPLMENDHLRIGQFFQDMKSRGQIRISHSVCQN